MGIKQHADPYCFVNSISSSSFSISYPTFKIVSIDLKRRVFAKLLTDASTTLIWDVELSFSTFKKIESTVKSAIP